MQRMRKILMTGLIILAMLTGYFIRGLTQVVIPEPSPAPTPTPTEVVQTPTPEPSSSPTAEPSSSPTAAVIDKDGVYDTRDDVALYIHTYGELPSNFMTKKEARKHGWESGALNRVIKGMCIGGDEFYNNEGRLPEKEGRIYYECDIGTINKKSRGAKRIIYSNDGLIYYTKDHYEHYTLLYGDESQ